jgi:signal transduction histidine kinase
MQWLSKGEMSVYEAQKRYVHRQGRIIWVFVTMSLVRDGQQRPLYYVAQAQDITERRAIEQKKHELVAIVSHKLRTPLTTIQASMNALASGVIAAEPDRAQQILEMAAIDTERLLHLVGAILDLEELESGRVPLRRIWCNAADLVQQAVQAVASLVDSAGISVEVSADPLRLWVDADRIQQALTHLLDNAIRSSAHGSTVWITAKTYERSTKVLRPSVSFTVRDQGRGIPANKLDTIFDRFQQVDTADDHKTNSTGLGLTICRAIAKQHGGQIWVESDLGRGSTFFLTVPMPMTSAG